MSRWIRIGDLALAYLGWGVFALALAFILAKDASVALDTPARVRAYIRAVEFDFVDWTLDALGFKARQSSVDEQAFLSNRDQTRRVRDYFDLIFRLEGVRREIEKQYADPAVKDPAAETAGLRVGVMPGGCSGFKYEMSIDEAPVEDDIVLDLSGVRVFVDPFSAQYLGGVSIDYVQTMQSAGFTFENPNATGG